MPNTDGGGASRRKFLQVGAVALATGLAGAPRVARAQAQVENNAVRSAPVLVGNIEDRPEPGGAFFENKVRYAYVYDPLNDEQRYWITDEQNSWSALPSAPWSDPDDDGYLQATSHTGVDINSLRMQAGHGLFGLPDQHVNWESGKTDEEAARYQLKGTEQLEVYRLGAALKGGGTDSSFTLKIVDASSSTTLASVTGGEVKTGSPLGASGAGATIVVQFSTGSTAVEATPTCINSIVKA